MIRSAPRPVSVPPTESAYRLPPCVVMSSRPVSFAHRRLGKSAAYHKAADAKVDLAADLQNVGELQLQRINIPARVLAKPVEREPQHPQFGLVEVGDGHGGGFSQAQPFGGDSPSPTRDQDPKSVV